MKFTQIMLQINDMEITLLYNLRLEHELHFPEMLRSIQNFLRPGKIANESFRLL